MARRTENRIELIGFLGQNPNFTAATDNTKARVNFDIATHRFRKDGDGRKQETDWHSCTAFDKLASDVIAPYAKGGAYVRVVGELRHRRVEGAEGEKPRYYSDVIVESFDYLDKRENDTDEPAGARE